MKHQLTRTLSLSYGKPLLVSVIKELTNGTYQRLDSLLVVAEHGVVYVVSTGKPKTRTTKRRKQRGRKTSTTSLNDKQFQTVTLHTFPVIMSRGTWKCVDSWNDGASVGQYSYGCWFLLFVLFVDYGVIVAFNDLQTHALVKDIEIIQYCRFNPLLEILVVTWVMVLVTQNPPNYYPHKARQGYTLVLNQSTFFDKVMN